MFDTREGGPSVVAGTLMHTARGLVPVENIELGDTVFSLDRTTKEIRPATVLDVMPNGMTETIEAKVGTRVIRARADARLLALIDRRRPGRHRRRFRAEWTALQDVKVGDIVAVARKTPDLGTVQELPLPSAMHDRRARPVTFPRLANEDLMWWSGLYLGDGYVTHAGHRKRVEFAIPRSQPDLQAELARVSRSLFGIAARVPDKWRVAVPGIRLTDYVAAIGLGGKALEKRVPPWVFRSPEAHRLAFLGGYIDADGMVRAACANKDMGATSANALLLEDVRRLAVTCGVRTTRIWTFTTHHPVDSARLMTGYRMQFSGDFDRIGCRAAQRRSRMNKRLFFHTETSIAGCPLKSHASEWLGFAKVRSVARLQVMHTYAITHKGADNLVAERLIVGAPEPGAR